MDHLALVKEGHEESETLEAMTANMGFVSVYEGNE